MKKELLKKSVLSSIIAVLMLLSLLQVNASPGLKAKAMAGGAIPQQSPESFSPDQDVIVRVGVKSEYEMALLAAENVDVLSELLNEKMFIRTKYAQLEHLQRLGWPVVLSYFRQPGPDGDWQAVTSSFECDSTINPTYKSFPGAGGFSSFDFVTEPDCEWVVFTDEPWLNVNGIRQGTGSREFSYFVAENETNIIREGHIFVAGQIFTVFQGRDFLDVSRSHPFYVEIGRLSARGVTLGCGGDLYCPNDVVTREQMAAFIIRALGEFNPPTPPMQRFADVPPSNPFYAFIEEMAVRQITLGCGGSNYCPTQPVLREQMAAFIIRGLGEFNPPEPAMQRFLDVPPTNPFYRFIDRLAELGITSGCSLTPPLFCPSDPVRRDQMAAFLVRAFNL